MRIEFAVIGLLAVAVAIVAKEKPRATFELANDFLGSLTPELRAKATKGFSDDYRTLWRFVPAKREGVELGALDATQAGKAAALLRGCLSDAGYKKAETIRGLEDVLYEMEHQNKGRDKKYYLFTFFGTPGASGQWGWRYEGHHVSLNFTYRGSELISSTPQFFGANPAEVRSGPQKGTRALAAEMDGGFSLLKSLTAEQKAIAVIPGAAPHEIVTSNARKVAIQKDEGLPWSKMSAAQQALFRKLVEIYLSALGESERKQRLSRVEYTTLVFAWMGATEPGMGHYYRIQGSKFLIEYDNTQNDANHIHAVWRDYDRDFGADLLAEHYSVSPHNSK